MAKAKTAAPAATKPSDAKAPGTSLALAADIFAADSGAGLEGADSEAFAIPFLSVLQKGSPQVDEASGVALDGAKAGMFFENVTGRMFDGKKGVLIVPCFYRRVFLRWAPKGNDGAGFKGELLPEAVAQMRAEGKIADLDGRLYVPLPDGTVNDKKCDRIADTRNHFVLLVDRESGGWAHALVSLSSTQIKKSKALNAALGNLKVPSAKGAVMPPTYASLVRATTVPESNDKGTWHGIRFELNGTLDVGDGSGKDMPIYLAARAFHQTVSKGGVEVKYEAPAESEPQEGKGF